MKLLQHVKKSHFPKPLELSGWSFVTSLLQHSGLKADSTGTGQWQGRGVRVCVCVCVCVCVRALAYPDSERHFPGLL